MKRALVTGASGGIGAAIARQLAADGYFVYIHANQRLESALELSEAINAHGGQSSALAFDVTNGELVERTLEAIIEQGPIQVLVNNAGVHDDAVFPGLRSEQWHRVIDITLNGFFNVTKPLMLPMIRTRWGRIVNVSSISAITGNRGQVNYSAAKGGLNSATKSLALEVASRGITVNAVAPGVIATESSAESFDAETIQRIVPMKRAGKAEEVADLVSFLCSERAAYITGQIISINGGII